MKLPISAALLTVAAVGVGRLAVDIVQHRERVAIDIARMHQRLMTDEQANPELNGLWHSYGELSGNDTAGFLRLNQWMSFWSLSHRLGSLHPDVLSRAARSVFTHPVAHRFWERSGPWRHRDAKLTDFIERRFVALLQEGYDEARRQDPVEMERAVGL